MKTLGIIPARGGSKEIPKKNIKKLGGKPLLAYTIEAALESKKLSRAILSTDDEEISRIGKKCGIEVPFIRPKPLSGDSANAIDVIKHAIVELETDTLNYDYIVMLQPTSPFRTYNDIDGALELLISQNADSVISVVNVGSFHPARMKYIKNDMLFDPPFCEEYENQPRQELEEMFIRNGAIYATKKSVLLNGSFKGEKSLPWIMDMEESVNIDTLMDLKYAEWILKEKNKIL